MPTVHDFHLPITTEATLKEFVRVAFGVIIPDTQVCKHHTTPFRAFADAYFARHPVSVWFASRGFGGKSFLLSEVIDGKITEMSGQASLRMSYRAPPGR